MNGRVRWAAAALVVAAAAVVGILSYGAGVSHGLAIAPALVSAAPPAALPYGWYRPWGWGWGFGFAPLFFLFFWFLVFRMFLWNGWHRRRGAFDEWHRRAHEQMNKPA